MCLTGGTSSPVCPFRSPRGKNEIIGKDALYEKKPFAFRISESTYKTLKQKARHGKVTMTEFLERAITDKKIVVVDGVQELISELKAIGRNLNQLTTLANMGKVKVVGLDKAVQELSEVSAALRSVMEGR